MSICLERINMASDSDLKYQSMKRAVEIFEEIQLASKTPEKSISGEILKIYQELLEWEFLERYPIADEKNRWLYITMLSLQQYRHLKWKKDHPTKQSEKKTKWQVVHGSVKKSGKTG